MAKHEVRRPLIAPRWAEKRDAAVREGTLRDSDPFAFAMRSKAFARNRKYTPGRSKLFGSHGQRPWV
jgi:hypothetical protein